MSMRSIYEHLQHSVVLVPQTLTATTLTSAVDLKDVDSAGFLVVTGAMAFDTSNYLTLNIQESDSSGSGFADAAAADLYSSNNVVLDEAGDASKSHFLGYRGSKRYIKLNIVETGTVSVPMSVDFISINPKLMPPL